MTNQETDTIKTELPMKWQASHFYGKKDSNWFWYLAAVAMIVIIIATVTKNFLLAVLAIVSYFTVSLIGSQNRQKNIFELTTEGIRINSALYSFGDMQSFWINYAPPYKKELVLKTKKLLIGYLRIPLGDNDPNKIRNILIKILQEEKHEESLLDIIADRMGL